MVSCRVGGLVVLLLAAVQTAHAYIVLALKTKGDVAEVVGYGEASADKVYKVPSAVPGDRFAFVHMQPNTVINLYDKRMKKIGKWTYEQYSDFILFAEADGSQVPKKYAKKIGKVKCWQQEVIPWTPPPAVAAGSDTAGTGRQFDGVEEPEPIFDRWLAAPQMPLKVLKDS